MSRVEWIVAVLIFAFVVIATRTWLVVEHPAPVVTIERLSVSPSQNSFEPW
jgi:hypothetical protein